MIRSFLDVGEVLSYRLFHKISLFEDFRFPRDCLSLNFGDDRVVPADPHQFVRHLIELFHSPFPEQQSEFMQILCGVDLPSDRQFLLLLLDLVLGSISDAYRSGTHLLLLPPHLLLHLLGHGIIPYVLICRAVNGSLCLHHVLSSLFHVH